MENRLTNFKKFILGYLMIAVCFTIAAIAVSCEGPMWKKAAGLSSASDSTKVASQIEAVINPSFNNVNEVLSYKARFEEGARIDSEFFAIPVQTLHNVCNVVLKNNVGPITKRDIVLEYRAHKQVYNNLPDKAPKDSTTSKKVDLGATDLGQRTKEKGVISTTYQYRTDSATGQKIQIKTEESYVE